MKTQISKFLKERQDRFKPAEANKLGLKRLQKIDFSGNMHFLEDKKTNTNMILIKPGDLVISGINVEKGAVAVYQGEEEVLATIHYSSYEFDKHKIDINYFKWFLKSDVFRKAVQSQTRGGIKTELKPKKFLPLEIPLPDLPTQKQILTKINSMKNEISELESTFNKDKTLLSSLRSAILQEAVQGKLVPQNPKDEPASELLKKIKKEKEKLIKEGKIKKGKELPAIEEDEIPYELPLGWVWCRLGDVCEFGYSEKIESKNITPETWILDLEDIEKTTSRLLTKKRFKDYPSKSTKNIFSKGDVLYGKLRPYLDKVIIAYESGVCTTEIIPLKIYNNLIDNRYLRYFLKNPNFLEYVNSLTYGVKMPRLGTNDGKLAPIPLPSLSEQNRIVEKVDALMSLCDEMELRVKENKESSGQLMNNVLREVFRN